MITPRDTQAAATLESLRAQVRYVPMRVAHHASCSGYDALFRASALAPAESDGLKRIARMIPGALAWRLWALRPQPSQQRGLEAEIGAAGWLCRGTGRLAHFIYGEDSYFLTPLWKRGANACVATFHYPPALLSRRINVGSLSSLDAVIIVGENQRSWFEQFTPAERIHFCPHHVQTDYFSPAEDADGEHEDRLVCVGKLLRDYDLLERVVRRLQAKGSRQVFLDIVAPKGLADHPITALPNVSVHSGISDDALRTLYRKASLGVLPLTDATANNALLEMMACGLPVLVSDVGGIPEYIADSGSIGMAAGDDTAWVAHIETLLADPAARAIAGRRNREKAVSAFSFEVCSARLADIYTRVLKARDAQAQPHR